MAPNTLAPSIPELADQQLCPLFCLPRELRDEIYWYYAYDEEGLAYDYPSKTLKYASGKELNLPRTCKEIANEMRGIHLRANTITFIPGSLEREEDTQNGLRSISARFEHLLYATRWTKMLMLHHLAECVTEDDIVKVTEAYPSVSSVFPSCFRAIRSAIDLRLASMNAYMSRGIFTASFCDAVQYALDLTANHPRFEELIAKACEASQAYAYHHDSFIPYFIPGSHRQVLHWRPPPWSIPTHDELCPMEDILIRVHSPNGGSFREYPLVKFYFSATAICIATIGRLPPSTRTQLRSIVLREECRGLGNPEVHAEGLIRYCMENHKLRFLMEAGFSTMLAPPFWSTCHCIDRAAPVYIYTGILIDWCMRTAALNQKGMPKGSFAVAFDARSYPALKIWRSVSTGAYKRANLPSELSDYEERNDVHHRVLDNMFANVFRLPVGLSSVIEDIIDGISVIRLEIPDGELLQPAELIKPFATWSPSEWLEAYRPRFENVGFPGDTRVYYETFYEI